MSPKTTPRAERISTPVRERRCEVTAASAVRCCTMADRASSPPSPCGAGHPRGRDSPFPSTESGPAGRRLRSLLRRSGAAPAARTVDYQVEHPIATLLVFRMLARVTGGRPAIRPRGRRPRSDRRRDHRRRAALGLGHGRGRVRRGRADPGARPVLQPRRSMVDGGRDRRGRGVAAAAADRPRLRDCDRRRVQAVAARVHAAAGGAVARPAVDHCARRVRRGRGGARRRRRSGSPVPVGCMQGTDVPRRHRLADRESGRQRAFT